MNEPTRKEQLTEALAKEGEELAHELRAATQEMNGLLREYSEYAADQKIAKVKKDIEVL